jgi:hypothetical protein
MPKLHELYLRISPDKFHLLKFILEAYDNLAILSSWDIGKGIVVIRCSDGMLKDFYSLLHALAPQLR